MEIADDDKTGNYRMLPMDVNLTGASDVSSRSFTEHDELFRSCPSLLDFESSKSNSSYPKKKSFISTHEIQNDNINENLISSLKLSGQINSLLNKRKRVPKRRPMSSDFLCSKTLMRTSVLDEFKKIRKICYEELLPLMKHAISSGYKASNSEGYIDYTAQCMFDLENIKVRNLPTKPFLLDSDTTFMLQERKPSAIYTKISEYIRTFDDLISNFDVSTFQWKCRSVKGSLEFNIFLYYIPSKRSYAVEVQRRCGCYLKFVEMYRKLHLEFNEDHNISNYEKINVENSVSKYKL